MDERVESTPRATVVRSAAGFAAGAIVDSRQLQCSAAVGALDGIARGRVFAVQNVSASAWQRRVLFS